MKWIEVKIITSHEAVDSISNILHEVGAGGVVIEDPQDLEIFQKEKGNWDYIDESLLKLENETVIIRGYLSETPDLLEKINLVRKRVEEISQYDINLGKGEVTTTEVHEEDWATAWKQYYKPTKIGKHIVIKPTWEEYEKKPDEDIIELDPGMAFGTGTHETTQLCVEFLEEHIQSGNNVLDIGTGSGILGIAAGKLGSSKVVAVDLDPVAVQVARKNITLNDLDHVVEVREGNLFDVIHEKADIVVANIIADIIISLSKDVHKFLVDKGIFIASGIILDRLDDVKEALEKQNITILSIKKMGEWAAICCTI
ncbi:50S ribosomal protein L11 methyltransferase [Irregularibacter muris]|uniref:Ribosomal protein L11 methyltransferase n=1 Tax=Irregularibacter muris TaxID=1796619 RepID=A0AAE3HFW8_9FIRM|nr:50S ribosomal protein L11 methyltransferase [Irregularibacter muris]MCR1897848.1 50S ribosomal protein L11 methyltransferase [Irregularibacter muris]